MLFGAFPIADPWIALTAIALATSRIRIGPMVTPVPRRRPVKLARETVTLDHLSNGRLILGVGIGAGPWEYDYLGEEGDPKVRGGMLDEGLEVLTHIWSGELFSFDGKHYSIHGTSGWERSTTPGEAQFRPPALQQPRIPVWVAGFWPNKPPFRRGARWDGIYPLKTSEAHEILTPDEVREIVRFTLAARAESGPFDVVLAGETSGDKPTQAAETIAAYRDAGMTWWLEGLDPWRFGWQEQGPWPVEAMRERVRQGPPRI